MQDRQSRSDWSRLAKLVVGCVVGLVTAPTVVGLAAGGWIGGHGTRRVGGGAVAGSLAGLPGAVSVGVLTYMASAGAIAPVGYHDGIVHVGINTAPPGLLAPWQELSLAAFVAVVCLGLAAAGGVAASSPVALVDRVRREATATE